MTEDPLVASRSAAESSTPVAPIMSVTKTVGWFQISREALADMARTWQERAILLRESDPSPFPRFHLFRKRLL
jgi:hypothetical protein